MRVLNLLRQIIYGDRIGALDEWKASSRHLWNILNLENSRRKWPDVLVISARELLRAAGYRQSRYANAIVKTFQTDITKAGIADVDTSTGTTAYLIHALTQADVAAAKARHQPKETVSIPPSLAAKLAEERQKARHDATGAGVNDINGINDIKGGKKKNGGGKIIGIGDSRRDGGSGSDGSDADGILRELADLGV